MSIVYSLYGFANKLFAFKQLIKPYVIKIIYLQLQYLLFFNVVVSRIEYNHWFSFNQHCHRIVQLPT